MFCALHRNSRTASPWHHLISIRFLAAKWFIFCVVFCQSSFVFYYFLFRSLCCVYFLDILRFYYPFGIFKLFLYILLNISNYYLINLITLFYWGLGSWPWSHDLLVIALSLLRRNMASWFTVWYLFRRNHDFTVWYLKTFILPSILKPWTKKLIKKTWIIFEAT